MAQETALKLKITYSRQQSLKSCSYLSHYKHKLQWILLSQVVHVHNIKNSIINMKYVVSICNQASENLLETTGDVRLG